MHPRMWLIEQVWRPGLFRRLQRLEKMLQVPEEERSQCEGELKQPQRVFIKAVRGLKRSNSIPLENSERSANAKNDEVGGLHAYFTPEKNATRVKMEDTPKDEVKENGHEKVPVFMHSKNSGFPLMFVLDESAELEGQIIVDRPR